MSIISLLEKIFKNIWIEFWNEFYGAWTGKVMVGFWGAAYTRLQKNHPFLAQVVCKGTALGYFFIWWLGFIVVFCSAIFVVPFLFYSSRATLPSWWVYASVWAVIISLPILIGFIGGWISDKAGKDISN